MKAQGFSCSAPLRIWTTLWILAYDGDEEAEDHVGEDGDEAVDVDPAEEPHHPAPLAQLSEGGVDGISVNHGEQAVRHHVEGAELRRGERGA